MQSRGLKKLTARSSKGTPGTVATFHCIGESAISPCNKSDIFGGARLEERAEARHGVGPKRLMLLAPVAV